MKIDVPFGTCWFRRVAIESQPGGREKIAQRLIAGHSSSTQRVPPGTEESFARRKGGTFFRPFGTWSSVAPVPSDESLGYARSSLRDCLQRQHLCSIPLLAALFLCCLIATPTLAAELKKPGLSPSYALFDPSRVIQIEIRLDPKDWHA